MEKMYYFFRTDLAQNINVFTPIKPSKGYFSMKLE